MIFFKKTTDHKNTGTNIFYISKWKKPIKNITYYMTPIYMTFWKIKKYWNSKMVFSRGERVWMGLRWGLKETTYWWKYIKDTQETTKWALYGQSCESSSNRIIWDFNPKYKISIGLCENVRKEGRKRRGRKKGKRKEKERNKNTHPPTPSHTHTHTNHKE